MIALELQQYLHEHIPLSEAMHVEVVSVDDDSVVLTAPLEPNINHRETVFGGSASAVAILAAWSLLHTRLLRRGIEGRIVIQRNSMNYLLPISGTFTARSAIAGDGDWQRFLRMLSKKGVARMSVSSVLHFAGERAGEFEGEFVAFASEVREARVRRGAAP